MKAADPAEGNWYVLYTKPRHEKKVAERLTGAGYTVYCPLQKDKGSAAKAGIFGSVITGFLLVLFFIGRVEAKNIMA